MNKDSIKNRFYVESPLGEDLVDSRDMLARMVCLVAVAEGFFARSFKEESKELDDADKDELKAYQELRAEIGEEYFDKGISFIKDTYFSQAMRDDFLEFNQIDEALECYIDFDAWETACSMDYTEIEIGGYAYSYRG